MERNQKRKKNKKAYYGSKKKAKRALKLDEGMKGFMLTCNNREKQCISEAYNLLNEFAEIMYGPEHNEDFDRVAESKDSSNSDEDVEKELEKELQGMKAIKVSERRFQAVDTNANNCLFIKTLVSNPMDLMNAILLDVEKKQKQRTRYLLRMIPVLHTCKSYVAVIKKHASEFLENHNDEIAKHNSFAVNFKARNNASIGRLEVINLLAALIHTQNPAIKADLKNPELVVSVDIIGTVCCFSLLPDYYRFKKYNLSEVASGNTAKNTHIKIKSDFAADANDMDKKEASPIKEMADHSNVATSGDESTVVKLGLSEKNSH